MVASPQSATGLVMTAFARIVRRVFCAVLRDELMHVVCKLAGSGSGAVHVGLVNRDVNELRRRAVC